MLKKFENGILQIKSQNPWPTCTLVACTHWNEIIGYHIFDHLLNQFKIKNKLLKWTINFVIWNPKAMEKNTRFIDKDLNRIWDFKEEDKNTYEYKRAMEIEDIIKNSDYVFDLHSTTNPSPFFLIPWRNIDNELLKWFNADFIVKSIIDLLHWKAIIKYAYEQNPKSQTLVMECHLKDKKDIEKAIENVLYYLNYYWFIESDNKKNEKEPIILDTKKVIHAKSLNVKFLYTEKPESFQKIKKWEKILEDNWEILIADDDYYILMPTPPRYIWEEIWYLLKEEI